MIQVGELRHHEGNQERQHHEQHEDQQRGIHQRGYQLLAKTHRQALKRYVASHHLLEVAALLAGQQRGRVDLGKHLLGGEGFRQQLPPAQAVAHILQNRTEEGIALPLNQQFQTTG